MPCRVLARAPNRSVADAFYSRPQAFRTAILSRFRDACLKLPVPPFSSADGAQAGPFVDRRPNSPVCATIGLATVLSWVRQLGEWIAAAAAFLGPWGVFFIALADSALIPMPQGVDALLVAQSIASPRVPVLAAGLGVLGSLLGSVILYCVGRGVGSATLAKKLSPAGVRRLQDLVGRWGAALLLPVTAIPLPLPMKPVVLAAGIFQMPLGSFCLAIVFARSVRYFGIVLLARRYGEQALTYAAEHAAVAVAACAVLVATFVAAHWLSNRWLNRPA